MEQHLFERAEYERKMETLASITPLPLSEVKQHFARLYAASPHPWHLVYDWVEEQAQRGERWWEQDRE